MEATKKKGAPPAEKKGAKKGVAAEGGAGSEWEPITDHSDFYARLQTVKQRKSSPGQPHCTPFSCSFVPRYAKLTLTLTPTLTLTLTPILNLALALALILTLALALARC